MMSTPRRRIVVTGLGVIAPNGLTIPDFWQSLIDGRSAAQILTRFDTSAMPAKIACEVRGFRPEEYIANSKARRYDPSILFAVAAAKLAVHDGALDLSRMDSDRVGIVEGTSVAAFQNLVQGLGEFQTRGWKSIQPTKMINAFAGGASSEIAIELQVHGQATTIATACSAGNDALGYAAQVIRNDVADVMIAGATEAPVVAPYFGLFAHTQAMSRWTGDPSAAMKPFDRDRDGFVIGEGAAFLLLEELGHALRRGAHIYCEWLGHGQACDAHSPMAVHPEGKGLKRAIERALFDANCEIEHVDYINPHASATAQNDPVESKTIEAVFGRNAKRIAISATKPVTGHLMGATAAIEAVICALAIDRSQIPPTANLRNPDRNCTLDYVPLHARAHPVRIAMNLNVGFGGKCSALLFGRYQQ
jgi:3-oxoacyl-[acyl-carrier-protein] synthase II